MLHQVYLSIGANLGNRQANILQALKFVQPRASIKKKSSFYETDPVGYVNQPKFLNIACELVTELSPTDLLHFLKRIEKQMGRRAAFRNAPRPIDMDILLYDAILFDSPDLQIPHPRMAERAFVLVPLVEIAPDLIHPDRDLTVTEILDKVTSAGVEKLDLGH